jgi:hypothetical protein
MKKMAGNANDELTGGGCSILLPVYGVTMNHENKISLFFKALASNTVNMNAPPLMMMMMMIKTNSIKSRPSEEHDKLKIQFV